MNWRDTGKIARIFGRALHAPALGTAFAFAVATMGNGIGARAQQTAPPAPAATAQAPAPGSAAPLTQASPKDVLGIWQGTLHIAQANRDLRTEVKIEKAQNAEYKTNFYSIDQGGQPISANKTSFENGELKFSIDAIGGSFQGTMSEDGKTITGTWTQGPNSLPLNLARTDPENAWPIPEPPKPMAADAHPSFDVATIKPNNSGATQMQRLTFGGRTFVIRAASLEDLMSFAYSVQAKQIAGGPEWMNSDRYDIDAVPDTEGVPNPEQTREMIQKMMADRFKLTFHHEQRDMSAYVLEVGKSGPKMTVNESKGQLPGLGFGPGAGGITLRAMNATIGDLTGFLQVLVLDRPVVDRTGLTARYDLTCTFTPDDSQFSGHPPRLPPQPAADGAQGSTTDVAAAPSLYEAMDQQLGLKLTAEKTNVDVMVIDHVEKPSPN